MIQISVWTYFAPEPAARSANSISSPGNGSTDRQSPAPKSIAIESLKKREETSLYGRDSRRKLTIERLSKPWSSFCDAEGRRSLISSLREYYYHRHNEARSAREVHGEEGASFVAGLYKTPEDSQIERLTQQTYVNGYVKLADFEGDSFARTALLGVVKDEKVRGKGCAS